MATTHSDTIVNSLVINKMTKVQYEALELKSDTELYLIPDEIDNTPTSGSDNPVTSDGIYLALLEKLDLLDSTNKLSADLIEDGTTNKVINVKPDWSAASGSDSEILNKPDLSTKADKVNNPTNGNFASLDANGNLADSGHKHSDYLTALASLTAYSSKGSSTKVPLITTNALGQVTLITEVNIDLPPIMGASGNSHAPGLVPDTPSTEGNTKYLREDGTWSKPPGEELPNNITYFSADTGEGIVPEDGIRAETVTAAATMTISPDVVTVINGAVGTAAITLQVPNDNLAHVWDILMTTDSTVAITFAMSNSATILAPSGFSIGASKAVEISVIGVGTKYYLRYGEFA